MPSAYYAERIRLGMPVNARFWIWWNQGWIKLTMKPGDTVTMHTGGATDEGYSCEDQTYEYDGECVQSSIDTWGRDCDGGHEWHGESSCQVTSLRDNEADEHGPARPEWKRGNCHQRDQYAELSGY